MWAVATASRRLLTPSFLYAIFIDAYAISHLKYTHAPVLAKVAASSSLG